MPLSLCFVTNSVPPVGCACLLPSSLASGEHRRLLSQLVSAAGRRESRQVRILLLSLEGLRGTTRFRWSALKALAPLAAPWPALARRTRPAPGIGKALAPLWPRSRCEHSPWPRLNLARRPAGQCERPRQMTGDRRARTAAASAARRGHNQIFLNFLAPPLLFRFSFFSPAIFFYYGFCGRITAAADVLNSTPTAASSSHFF